MDEPCLHIPPPVTLTVEEERRALWIANSIVEWLKDEEVKPSEGLTAMLLLIHQHIAAVPDPQGQEYMALALQLLTGNFEVMQSENMQ